jgi:hypothetical protein
VVERNNTNKPEIRHMNILTRRPENAQVCIVDQELTIQKLKELNVHNSLMIDYFESCYCVKNFVKKVKEV